MPKLPIYNIYDQECPARMVMERLADKWALLILDLLSEEPMRFNQLRREIGGISQKVLSQTLKKLERDGLVSRAAFATVPVTVEYRLAPLGQELHKTASVLAHWAEANMDAVILAQQTYDQARTAD